MGCFCRCCDDWDDDEADEHDNKPARIYTPEEIRAWSEAFLAEYLAPLTERADG